MTLSGRDRLSLPLVSISLRLHAPARLLRTASTTSTIANNITKGTVSPTMRAVLSFSKINKNQA